LSAAQDWKARFEQTYAGAPSPVAERVWRQVFGDEYPQGVDPYSFITVSELERIATDIRVDETETFADLGCGRGGPGLWVAAATRARLIGVDISSNALDAARERAAAMGFHERAEFRAGSFESTGLPTNSVDAVMSIDALLFAADKAAAIGELRRVLKRGGRFVFTSWDYHRQPPGRPPQVEDHRPVLTSAGFVVLAYDVTDDWQQRISDISARLIDNATELAAESGDDVAETRARLEEMRASIDAMSRRILVVAEAR
jgi:cyclopropane fatty-acyl-phospholipid synthase-like methyltransferase